MFARPAGGGYSYRLCKQTPGKNLTEECFQQTPLKFATETTEIKVLDGSGRPSFFINATTTNKGTFPTGSQWRKNPIPMCNCDVGAYCEGSQHSTATEVEPLNDHKKVDFLRQMEGSGKKCQQVPSDQCGNDYATSCLKCGSKSAYDCEKCCPGFTPKKFGGYTWCEKGGSGPSKSSYFKPYSKSHVQPGQKTPLCPTGVMFPIPDSLIAVGGYGNGLSSSKYKGFEFSMVDKLVVPDNLEPGLWSLSWRWDCEQTPQVWNSCADVHIKK